MDPIYCRLGLHEVEMVMTSFQKLCGILYTIQIYAASRHSPIISRIIKWTKIALQIILYNYVIRGNRCLTDEKFPIESWFYYVALYIVKSQENWKIYLLFWTRKSKLWHKIKQLFFQDLKKKFFLVLFFIKTRKWPPKNKMAVSQFSI